MSDLDTLHRWYAAGAAWRVERRSQEGVTVALLRCDGGEVVDTITSADPDWLAYLDGRSTSGD